MCLSPEAKHQFYRQLHRMIEAAPGLSDPPAIQWGPGGNGLIITDKRALLEHVLPIYFEDMKSNETLTRRFNRSDMYKVRSGPEKGLWKHKKDGVFFRGSHGRVDDNVPASVKGPNVADNLIQFYGTNFAENSIRVQNPGQNHLDRFQIQNHLLLFRPKNDAFAASGAPPQQDPPRGCTPRNCFGAVSFLSPPSGLTPVMGNSQNSSTTSSTSNDGLVAKKAKLDSNQSVQKIPKKDMRRDLANFFQNLENSITDDMIRGNHNDLTLVQTEKGVVMAKVPLPKNILCRSDNGLDEFALKVCKGEVGSEYEYEDSDADEE